MGGGVKTMLGGVGCIVVGILWIWISSAISPWLDWRQGWNVGWANLWDICKGGMALFILAAAMIALFLGGIQSHEDRENLRRQEEEKTA